VPTILEYTRDLLVGSDALFLAFRLRLLLDHSLAAIEAIGRDAMAQVLLARLRVDGQCWGREAVMGTVHAAF